MTKPIHTPFDLKAILQPNRLYSCRELRDFIKKSHPKDLGNVKIAAILDKAKSLLECENFMYYKKY